MVEDGSHADGVDVRAMSNKKLHQIRTPPVYGMLQRRVAQVIQESAAFEKDPYQAVKAGFNRDIERVSKFHSPVEITRKVDGLAGRDPLLHLEEFP